MKPFINLLKRINSIGCAGLCLLILSCAGAKTPAVVFDGTKYKFGEVKEGEQVVFAFTYKNTGKAGLVLTDLSVSCFCVEVKTYNRDVAPGNRGQINGVINTKGFQGDIVKMIQVKTNVPGLEPVVLSIEGKILAADKPAAAP